MLLWALLRRIGLAGAVAGSVWGAVMAEPVVRMNRVEGIGFRDRFEVFDPLQWHRANYRFDHPLFDTDWSHKNVASQNGLTLHLTPQTGQKNRFTGGSIRTHHPVRFGRFETLMQPGSGDGVVTGFFTYTGPHYGTRHDEIDIEFLGRDTRNIHLSWWVDGQLSTRVIALGFDAADTMHRYGFEWDQHGIRWFVDGRMIFEVTDQETAIPQVAGYVFANIWSAGAPLASWAGRSDAGHRAQARVGVIDYRPLAEQIAQAEGEAPQG